MTGTKQVAASASGYMGPRGGAGLTIRYTVVGSRFADVLVGTTERGVCAVLFGDAGRLPEDLAVEFPGATLVRSDEALRTWAVAVAEAMTGHDVVAPGPLDPRGTDFQRRVWAELQCVPAGETATYAQIAARIGRPTAVRAVASACASNHVAVIVPCHRVVRGDGGLGGYRWGVEIKRALLEGEAAARVE